MLKIVADLHTHSVVSAHAYSTILENCQAAAARGLFAIATTDHAPQITDGAHPYFFRGLSNVLPRHVGGVYLLRGIEGNLRDEHGSIDIEPEWQNILDFGIASIHDETFGVSDPDRTTAAYLAVLDNPCVDILGHSGTVRYTYDYERVIKKCADVGKLIEINAATFRYRKQSLANCRAIAALCKKHGVGIMVNSDSHVAATVGVVDAALAMLEELEFPEELVINGSIPRLAEYFKTRRGLDILA